MLPGTPVVQTPEPADEWQSWDTPAVAETVAPPPQEAGLAEALSGLLENQATYDEPAAYASSHTAADFASQAPAQEASYESNFVADADQPPGWAEFQESFKTDSSFSDAPAAIPAADVPTETAAADLGWVEPAIPDEVFEEAATVAAPEPAPAPTPAPAPAPVVHPAISASNPFLAPPPLPPPPVPEVVAEAPPEEPVAEVAADAAPAAESSAGRSV